MKTYENMAVLQGFSLLCGARVVVPGLREREKATEKLTFTVS